MKMKIKTIYGLLVASMVLTIVNAAITYDNIREKEESTDQIIKSYKIIQSSTQLLVLFMDMETGERGFAITGDSAFLDDYRQADVMLQTEIATLSGLTSHKVLHDRRQREILTLSRAKRDELDRAVFNRANALGAHATLVAATGNQKLDSLRMLVKDIVAQEEQVLQEHNIVLADNRKLDPLRFSAFGLIGVTCFLAFVTLQRNEKSNRRLLKKLRMANLKLEEKVQKRTRQLVAANQAKDHFLGIATHDLKAPLQGVLGLVGLMKLEQRERNSPDLEYLTRMEESCRKMQRLITDLLDVNRIDQGMMHIQKESIDVSRLVERVEAEFFQHAQQKGITLIVNKIGANLHTDSDALSRILENLVSNAIKFSPWHRTVQLVTTPLGDAVQFEVKDEGPGIAEDDLPKLFGKFQRLANKPTSKENSTGLGLAIVKELTTLLNGSITVKSNVGIGTVFTVVIPGLQHEVTNRVARENMNLHVALPQ
ncbi:sensor histidine kinase [Chryseolinea lacunae]|uniref:histidine kinase n=1 Tax=Chryseolinea lacunae TaxID=2801331 RepID=A0ABS1KMP1_9BACT|nr:ATP-binding protein [Chryseolinea lacunae]MBL0740600.1 CHASE3 domain-containing protein [Chryseolinea lacunae]